MDSLLLSLFSCLVCVCTFKFFNLERGGEKEIEISPPYKYSFELDSQKQKRVKDNFIQQMRTQNLCLKIALVTGSNFFIDFCLQLQTIPSLIFIFIAQSDVLTIKLNYANFLLNMLQLLSITYSMSFKLLSQIQKFLHNLSQFYFQLHPAFAIKALILQPETCSFLQTTPFLYSISTNILCCSQNGFFLSTKGTVHTSVTQLTCLVFSKVFFFMLHNVQQEDVFKVKH